MAGPLHTRATVFPYLLCDSYRDVRSETTGGLQGADSASNVALATTLLIGRSSMSTKTAPGFRSMSEFDPALPAMVHDQLNDETFEGSQRSGWSTTDNTPATLG